jgi:hypothetical protein
MKFLNFLLFLLVFVALLDADPDSGSTDPIESGTNPDPKHWVLERFRICQVVKCSVGTATARPSSAGWCLFRTVPQQPGSYFGVCPFTFRILQSLRFL